MNSRINLRGSIVVERSYKWNNSNDEILLLVIKMKLTEPGNEVNDEEKYS